MTGRLVRVLVIDDSALMRKLLSAMLSADPEIEVIDTAPDPYVAREKIKRLNPDVITLDIEMPKMDGLEFLRKIMALRPMPVVMVSSLTQTGAEATLQALEIGAIDFVAKPATDIEAGLKAKQAEIIDKVKAAARARVSRRSNASGRPAAVARVAAGYSSTEKIIAIGASTGGVEALREIVCAMPPDCPATLITQHMPERFTQTFAARLDTMCAAAVSEARDGDRALPGHIYIAPGDRHLELARSGANYVCRIHAGPPVSGHRPSVDVLFRSVAQTAGANAIGVILTGMGKDGAAGLLEMRKAGATTFGQNEATCVVYGMPRVAFEMGAVGEQAPLGQMAERILGACATGKVRAVRV